MRRRINKELGEEDGTWIRCRAMEARHGFVERLEDERHLQEYVAPEQREQNPLVYAVSRYRVDLVEAINQ